MTYKEKPAMKRDRLQDFLGRENSNRNGPGIGKQFVLLGKNIK